MSEKAKGEFDGWMSRLNKGEFIDSAIVATLVGCIRRCEDDSEVAHGMEDDLHLRKIADDRIHESAKKIAAEALTTTSLQFSRWYA